MFLYFKSYLKLGPVLVLLTFMQTVLLEHNGILKLRYKLFSFLIK